ncbi:hypothetical protein [Humibacillus xanthopallidus]|uniref:hypothetical protein n=1 Tax=Humibacillus xanthopallidus TaxID=412689 RepID=UPI003850BE40
MPDRSSRRRPDPSRRPRSGLASALGRARWAGVSVLTVALVLGGCSTGEPTTSAGGSASSASLGATSAPSSATETDTDLVPARSGDFGVVPPEAWAEATDRAGDVPDLDLVLLSSRKVAGFSNNLVVLTSVGDAASLEAEIAKGREQMGAAGRTVSETPDKQVAGVAARGFQTAFEQQGIQVVARSYGLTRSGKVYLLTLSASEQDAEHAMTELDEILASWTWS